MPILLKASDIIERNTPDLIKQSKILTDRGLTPSLEVILVGNSPASEAYVAHKEKFCHKIGADFKLTRLPENTGVDEFIKALDQMNSNPKTTGCFVQLPVPKQLAHINTTQLIAPQKDVDGFHLQTVCDLYEGNLNNIMPCTPKGILTLLSENNIEVSGKNITIIGRSHIVGKPLALIFESMNATVTLCHSRTKDLTIHTKNADIIIAAVGIPKLINKTHLNENIEQVLIDVGINKVDGKLIGDIDFNDTQSSAYAITPVPGGVGPMTVYSLMQNLIKTTEIILNKRNK
jgi:methylenetetrahydrofolate dehydrogenase (NADP+)/methenyltetrahydrofolate cyclohydrolase